MSDARLLILLKTLRPISRLTSQDGDKIYECSLSWGARQMPYGVEEECKKERKKMKSYDLS